MRRADMEVGMEVLVSRDQDWQRWANGTRVLVVDLGEWHIRKGHRYGAEAPTIELDGETYTLSAGVMRSTGVWRGSRPVNAFIGRAYGADGLDQPKAYRLLSAKGPWAEAHALQEKNEKARRSAQAEADAERERLNIKSADLAGRMVDLGINAGYLMPNDRGRASIHLDLLERLIMLAEANRS